MFKRTFFAFAALGLLSSSALAAPAFFEPPKTVADFKLAINGGSAEDAIAHGLLAAAVVSTFMENDPGFTTRKPIHQTAPNVGMMANGGESGIAPPARKPIEQVAPSNKVATITEIVITPPAKKPIHVV